MAIETGDGLSQHETYPSALSTDLIGEAVYKEAMNMKKSFRIRMEKEHACDAITLGTSGAGGEHLPGSAKIYHGDYSSAWPVHRPVGTTDFTADDTGRIAIDTTTSPNRVAVYIYGIGWVNIGLLLGSTLLVPSEIKLLERTGDPTNVANYGFIYTKDVGAVTELFYIDSAGTVKQITNAGKFNIVATDIAADLLNDTKIKLRNNQPLRTFDAAGTGTVNALKVNASDLLELMTGAVLATDTAPASNAAIANKKYVDDKFPAYTGGESVTLPNGLILKFGTTSVGANTSANVVFGVAFTTLIMILVSIENSDVVGGNSGNMNLKTKATTGFTVFNTEDVTCTAHWIAIGY
jgi:hypothetical protein